MHFHIFMQGNVYNTDIGRYCSVARDVNIGQGNHPMKTFSTSPLFYQKSFILGLDDTCELKHKLDERLLSSGKSLSILEK